MRLFVDPAALRLEATRLAAGATEHRSSGIMLANQQTALVGAAVPWIGLGALAFSRDASRLSADLAQTAALLDDTASLLSSYATTMEGYINKLAPAAQTLGLPFAQGTGYDFGLLSSAVDVLIITLRHQLPASVHGPQQALIQARLDQALQVHQLVSEAASYDQAASVALATAAPSRHPRHTNSQGSRIVSAVDSGLNVLAMVGGVLPRMAATMLGYRILRKVTQSGAVYYIAQGGELSADAPLYQRFLGGFARIGGGMPIEPADNVFRLASNGDVAATFSATGAMRQSMVTTFDAANPAFWEASLRGGGLVGMVAGVLPNLYNYSPWGAKSAQGYASSGFLAHTTVDAITMGGVGALSSAAGAIAGESALAIGLSIPGVDVIAGAVAGYVLVNSVLNSSWGQAMTHDVTHGLQIAYHDIGQGAISFFHGAENSVTSVGKTFQSIGNTLGGWASSLL